MDTQASFNVPDSPELKRRDWKIISLVGMNHACSHFFQLVIPTLYLALASEYGYDFVKLGMLASTFYVVSCLGQASSGFIVDRIGPGPVLRFGLACFVVSGGLIGLSNGYFLLMLGAIIGGVGNSIFHPVDYSIINLRVSPRRLGHAYSTHGFTGNLGWALTPVFMLAIIHVANWRVAAFAAAALVGTALLLTWLARDLLSGNDVPGVAVSPAPGGEPAAGLSVATTRAGPTGQARQTVMGTLAELLIKPALWGAFLFFVFTAMALSAVQNYTIPMLGSVYGVDIVLAGTALSIYMVASAAGMILGGFMVTATPHTERTIAATLVLAGVLLVVLAGGAVAASFAVVLMGFAGFFSGIANPSRDMLIRRVAPKGAAGAVYGLVYSGIDLGSSIGPVGFGLLLDAGYDQGPWYGSAAAFVIAAFLAIWVAKAANLQDGVAPRRAAGKPA